MLAAGETNPRGLGTTNLTHKDAEMFNSGVQFLPQGVTDKGMMATKSSVFSPKSRHSASESRHSVLESRHFA